MNCICGGITHVVDSRKSGNEVRRYRKCKACGKKLVTVERFEVMAAKPEQMVVEPPKQSRSITAAERKRRQMEVRRKVEDLHLKRRVPDYFIEDEYDE